MNESKTLQFKLLTGLSSGVDRQLQWLIYSERKQSFIVGDEKKAVAISVPGGGTIDVSAAASGACNLPVEVGVYEEFIESPWHGFRFLERAAYEQAVDEKGRPVGDLLRTLVFLPDYGHYVLHPPSGLVFGLRSGSIEMLRREGDSFKSVEKTKTRGRAALAFAAHPKENLIAYGDNYGTFHVQRFEADGFGKASKIIARDRKASRLEFVKGGDLLVIGGMGYLETYSYSGGKFALVHQTEMPVRDFLWLKDGELVLVNQGMHGVAALRYDGGGFVKIGGAQPEGAMQQMTVSTCMKYLATSEQDSGRISLFEILFTV
jgi:hypothetical protein